MFEKKQFSLIFVFTKPINNKIITIIFGHAVLVEDLKYANYLREIFIKNA